MRPNVGIVSGPRWRKGIIDREVSLAKQIRLRKYTRAALQLLPQCSAAPSTTQIANAIHSAGEKCPGKAGSTFIRTSINETRIPSPATNLIPVRFSTIQKEAQAASQPRADAIDPTSVTGTSRASPSSRPPSVPAVIPNTATEGVRNSECIVPKPGWIVRRRPNANSIRLEATKFPLKH